MNFPSRVELLFQRLSPPPKVVARVRLEFEVVVVEYVLGGDHVGRGSHEGDQSTWIDHLTNPPQRVLAGKLMSPSSFFKNFKYKALKNRSDL